MISRHLIPVGALLLSTAALVLCLATVPPDGAATGWFALVVLLAGVFPLSALAFGWLEVPGIIEQVKRDCYLLGTERTLDRRSDPSAGRWSQGSYAIHYSLAVVATLIGVNLLFAQRHDLVSANALSAMRFGFLGAYVYCLGLIYRRYTTLDLQPHVYLYCAAALTAGMVFNYVAFEAITKVAGSGSTAEFTGIGAAASSILAFSLGYFPNMAIGWFSQLSQTAFRQGARRSESLPLSLIDGVSELHETRLRDEGVDNIQNLASANIRDLVIKTPFGAQEIVEWIDQAVLYLYLDSGEIAGFRRAGVRCVTDFADLWRDYCVRYEQLVDGTFKRIPAQAAGAENDFDRRRKAIAQQLQTTEERLDALYRATEQGPNMHFVKTYWNNVEALETEVRARVAQEVCDRVGCFARMTARQGTSLTAADTLKLVIEGLLCEASASNGESANGSTSAPALYGRAFLNRLVGNATQARKLYEQCIERFPEDPAAFNDLAWFYVEIVRDPSLFGQAHQYAITAVELATRFPDHRSELAGYLDTLAVALIRLKRPKEALERIKEALDAWKATHPNKIQPKLLETFVAAAEELHNQGHLKEASLAALAVIAAGYADEQVLNRARRISDG